MGAELLSLGATDDALEVIDRVRAERGNDLVFVFDGGCCEATAPYLYDHYLVDPSRACIGEVAGIKGYMPEWLADLFKHPTHLVIDVQHDVVTDSFSAEADFGCRFILRQSACPRA